MKTLLTVTAKYCAMFFVTVLSVALLTSSAHAARSGSTLIVRMQGRDKAGVRVVLSGARLAKARRATTANSGVARFRGLPAGTYTATPVKKGHLFSPPSETITFTTDRTQVLKFDVTLSQRKAGIANCARCHSKGSSPEAYKAWLQGPHGNFDLMDSTTHRLSSYAGFLAAAAYPGDATKFIGFPYPAEMEESIERDASLSGQTIAYCQACHGPSAADNAQVARLPLVKSDGSVDAANHTQAARSIIGCEACHGGGKSHMKSPGKVEVSNPEPAAEACGQCHNESFPSGHLTYHPVGAGGAGNPGIYEAYSASPHTQSVNRFVFTSDKRDEVQVACSKCHTDQGAQLYKDLQGDDATALNAQFAGKKNLTAFDAVQCRTCHDAHDPSKLLLEASAATGTAGARSAEFNTCTSCHQLLGSSDTAVTGYHTGSGIARNHWDNPLTPDWENVASPEENTKVQEGYNVKRGEADACSACHNPHNPDLTINRQWAESGHGDLTGLAWNEDDWKDNGNPFATTPTYGQQGCQKCHTATGFKNRIADPDAYDAAISKPNRTPINDFSYLQNGQEEVLYCWACHSDSAFNRRPFPSVKFPSGLSVSMGDDSNLCMGCHQGRQSKVSVDNAAGRKVSNVTVNPAQYGFVNIHYFAAAATLFGSDVKGGYEYDGRTYAGRNTFPFHQGRLDTCVKCHAREGTDEYPDHRFEPQVTDCSGCHQGITEFADIRPAHLSDLDNDGNTSEGVKGEIDGLRSILYTQIRAYAESVIIPSNPNGNSNIDTTGWRICYDAHGASGQYWFKDANNDGVWSGSETSEPRYNRFDKRLLKAAYNYQVSMKDPNGYIHNFTYFGQLLYDSIKDLGDNGGNPALVTGLIRPN